MVGLVRARVNARKSGEEITITGEVHRVPVTAPYEVKLLEVPLKEIPSTVTVTGFTETTVAPAAGQFKVDYDTGYIMFNSANAGTKVVCGYKGTGSLVDAKDLEDINNAFKAVANDARFNRINGLRTLLRRFRFPSRSYRVTTSGTWAFTTNASCTDDSGGFNYSDTAGAYTELTFHGTGVRVIFKKGTDQGIVSVSIDGVSPLQNPTIDQYAASNTFLQFVDYTGLEYGQHTIRLTRSGTKNSSATGTIINVDCFDVLLRGTDFLRAELSGADTICDINNSAITWTGSWAAVADDTSRPHLGYRTATAAAAQAALTFTGGAVTVWLGMGTNKGAFKIQVDGVNVLNGDAYKSTGGMDYFPVDISGLGPGEHTIAFIVEGAKATPSSANTILLWGFTTYGEPDDLNNPFDTGWGACYPRGMAARYAQQEFQLPSADASNPRWDLIVITAATGSIVVAQGTAAASPSFPALSSYPNPAIISMMYRPKATDADKNIHWQTPSTIPFLLDLRIYADSSFCLVTGYTAATSTTAGVLSGLLYIDKPFLRLEGTLNSGGSSGGTTTITFKANGNTIGSSAVSNSSNSVQNSSFDLMLDLSSYLGNIIRLTADLSITSGGTWSFLEGPYPALYSKNRR